MTPPGVLETVLYVDDHKVARQFYSDVFGLEPFRIIEGRDMFFRFGNRFLLVINAEVTRVPAEGAAVIVPTHGAVGIGHVCFCAGADEIANWREHVIDLAVEIEADFEWPQGGRSIHFRDPSGNSLEFAEPRIWGLQ